MERSNPDPKPSKLSQALRTIHHNFVMHAMDYFVICIGTLIGAGFGLLVTLVVMSTLVCVSISGPINLYYGLMTATLGTMMLVKTYRKNKIVELDGAD